MLWVTKVSKQWLHNNIMHYCYKCHLGSLWLNSSQQW